MTDIERTPFDVDGKTLSALVAGPAGGEAIVLLHGIPACAELWRGVLPHLAASGYRAWAPDLPGYGLTRPGEDGDCSLAGAAELVAAWLRASFDGPVWLVGHDLGGAAAQILATRHPELVSRLTLGDTVVEDSWPVLPIRLFRMIARLGLFPALASAGLVPNPYAWRALRHGFYDPKRLDPQDASRVFWERKVSDPEGRRLFARHLSALDTIQTLEASPNLAQLEAPTLLLWARHDRFQPFETVGRRLAALLPEPDVVLIDDAGHFVPLERPDAYATALLDWRRGGGS